MLMGADETLDFKKLAGLFSRDLEPEILAVGDQAAGLFEAAAAPARKKLRSQEISMDVALDFALGALRESVSGDDEVGYRVTYSSSLDAGQSFDVYVVRDGAEHRIAGLSTAVPMLGSEALRRLGRGDLKGARQWLDWAREHHEGGNRGNRGNETGDPFPADAFAALWTQGTEATAEDARCAAAALLNSDEGAKTLPLLRACREAAEGEARRNALDVALAWNAFGAKRYGEMAEITRRLVAAAPGSEQAERLHVLALTSLRRWDEIRVLAESRLKRRPGDGAALRLLAQNAVVTQDFDGAEKQLRQLIGTGKAEANDFNQLAWILLERGRADETALEYGQRAAALSGYGDPSFLHTLAAIYADQGKTAEAYKIILQSLAAKPDEAPDSHDWYVFGRLAEHYGLPDVARKYYKKVAPPERPEEESMSTHALAARRLAALGEEKKPQKARL
ncbi:MAG TPA: hypothetical protein VHC97_20835 [Thermoanaerobaculia bacterium]|jgi:tetratricopeptide (TPR) repeat protein|nr:hypothetical protein [Thermoanaerobaculia bacterium]